MSAELYDHNGSGKWETLTPEPLAASELDTALTAAYAEGRKDEREAHAALRDVVEQILDSGHMNTEYLARLRAAWEAT